MACILHLIHPTAVLQQMQKYKTGLTRYWEKYVILLEWDLCAVQATAKDLVKAFVANFSMMDRRNHKMSLYPKKPRSTFS